MAQRRRLCAAARMAHCDAPRSKENGASNAHAANRANHSAGRTVEAQ